MFLFHEVGQQLEGGVEQYFVLIVPAFVQGGDFQL